MEKPEAFLQDKFRERFPDVIVKRDPQIAADDCAPFYDVFMVSDDRRIEFNDYLIDEVWKIAEENAVVPPHIFINDVSETQKFHPEIYAECRRKNVQRSASARRTAKPRRTSVQAPKQKAVAARKA